jgi:hypothetical protein
MTDQHPPGRTIPDPLHQVVFNLARELWVIKDRQMVLEDVLKSRGIDAAELVDQHQPGPELARQLDEERAQLLERVFQPMTAAD